MSDFSYVGSELELFKEVHNWKAYWSKQIRPFIFGDVLEVGAGVGANTQLLNPDGKLRWVALEPDPGMAATLSKNLPAQHEVVCGTIGSLAPDRRFDSIVYVDVLEHIERDQEELQTAAARLRSGGTIVVLSPAHQRLFSSFDASIGHYRRYDRTMLKRISPPGLVLERMWYLDCVGITLSAANSLLLRQSMPAPAQLKFWDRCIVPISRLLDPLLFYSLGKTIIAVWRKP